MAWRLLRWKSRLQAGAAQFLLGIVGLALITFLCFRLDFDPGRTGFAYVILVALLSLLGSYGASVVLSIVAAASLNYFFTPPLFELHIDAPDIERIGAFLTTSLVVTALTTKVRASEARFRTFADHATDAFFLLDDDSTVLDVNRRAYAGLGYSRGELIGKHRSDFDVGLDEWSIERLKQRIAAGETVAFETRHRRKDGASFPVEVRVGQFEQGGRRFLCLARDITERKRAEDELRASEAQFRTFVDYATDAFFLFGDRLLDVNRQACEGLGYSREEMIGMHPRDFDAGLDAASIASIGERVESGETVTFETLHRRKDGTVFPVEVRARQFLQGAHRFRLALARDITERKRADEALRRSEAYLAEAQRLSHTGTIVLSATGPVYWSEESYQIWGLDPLQGLPDLDTVLQRIHPDDRNTVTEEVFEALHQRRRYEIEFRIVLPGGIVNHLESIGHPLLSAAGELEMVVTHIDVTERKRAQKERERLRELESELAV